MIRSTALTLGFSLFAFAAAAQSLPRLDTGGTVTGGLTTRDEAAAIGRFDLTFDLPLQRGPDPALTFELGLFSFLRGGSHPHETYAALAWDDRLRLGVVRPAYDGVLLSPFALAAPLVEDETLATTRAHATEQAMRRTAVPYGLSWSQQTGALLWDLSLHDAAKGGFRAASLAASWETGSWTLAGAAEGVWERETGNWEGANVKLGLRRDFGQAEAGLALLHPDANEAPDALEMDLRMPLAPSLTLGAMAHLEDASDGDRYGLSAEYALSPSDALAVTATGGSKSALHAGLTHRF